MRFLDLDLDFFLNRNAYCRGHDGDRLDARYKPWRISKVRHFLEKRCNLSIDVPIPGRTLEDHVNVIDLWNFLIEAGDLKVPFEVIHIDAHPDLSVLSGLYLESGLLYIDTRRGVKLLKRADLHSGNYLTFAIESGWVSSCIWVALIKTVKDLPRGYSEASVKPLLKDSGSARSRIGVSYQILPWNKFETSEIFNYMALSRSPNFTPSESDKLVPIIEEYMRQI